MEVHETSRNLNRLKASRNCQLQVPVFDSVVSTQQMDISDPCAKWRLMGLLETSKTFERFPICSIAGPHEFTHNACLLQICHRLMRKHDDGPNQAELILTWCPSSWSVRMVSSDSRQTEFRCILGRFCFMDQEPQISMDGFPWTADHEAWTMVHGPWSMVQLSVRGGAIGTVFERG